MYVGIGGPKGYEQVTIREDVYNPATGGDFVLVAPLFREN
jgi:hypothetical protein